MTFTKTPLVALCLGLAALTGCETELDVDSQEELGVAEQALSCVDSAGKWQHLANLAVAVAQEMGELNTSEQFAVVGAGLTEKVALSTYGQSVCNARGGCPMVEELLGLQDVPNDVYVDQTIFNTVDYRNSLVAMYRQQVTQISGLVANKRFDLLPEDHSVSYLGQDGTATCGTPWFSFKVNRDFHFAWRSSGTVADMTCTQVTEPSDPYTWNDNYLCSERNLGLKWSSWGSIAGMSCVKVNEPGDPNGWDNNYLCAPENWGLAWSYAGPVAGKECVQISEGADPHYWNDNYLCWDPNAKLLHPTTLCQEFWMYGGAASCGGSNPYIDFVTSSDNTKFKIDPTDYNSGGITTSTSGSCISTLPYVSTTYSVGKCCYYKGVYGTLQKVTTKVNTYYCKI